MGLGKDFSGAYGGKRKKPKKKKQKMISKMSKDEKKNFAKKTISDTRSYAKEHGLPDRVAKQMVGASYLRHDQKIKNEKNAKRTRMKQAAQRGRQYD